MASALQKLEALEKKLNKIDSSQVSVRAIPAEWMIKNAEGKFNPPPEEATKAERSMYETLVAMHRTISDC
jgi:hypothetical protein